MNKIIHTGSYLVGGIDRIINQYSRIEVEGDIIVSGTDHFISHICKSPNGPTLIITGNLEVSGVENTVYGVFQKGNIHNHGIGNIIKAATA